MCEFAANSVFTKPTRPTMTLLTFTLLDYLGSFPFSPFPSSANLHGRTTFLWWCSNLRCIPKTIIPEKQPKIHHQNTKKVYNMEPEITPPKKKNHLYRYQLTDFFQVSCWPIRFLTGKIKQNSEFQWCFPTGVPSGVSQTQHPKVEIPW